MNTLPADFLPLHAAYYDSQRKFYWVKNSREGWIQINEASLRRDLKMSGISPRLREQKSVSDLDEALHRIQHKQDVDYAGPLAGYSAGACQVMSHRVLVTSSPQLIIPQPGEWPILGKLLEQLLVDAQHDQRTYVFGWLKVAIEALASGDRRTGQCLVLCGPHNCGKSLFQNIITRLLGGRSAKPFQFMTGQTSFNSDLFEAEHLIIEDEPASTDIRTRRFFGAALKNITGAETQRHHAKNRPALTLTPFWRLSITVNDEPENLMVLPPIDNSIVDKIILLKAFKRAMPMPTNSAEQYKKFWKTLEAELPAFTFFLKNFEIPEKLSDQRYGISHFHHPDLLSIIDGLAPEQRLLALIDNQLFLDGKTPWEGTAEELEQKLTADGSRSALMAQKLFYYPTACGVYLGRLASKQPERVQKHRTADLRRWVIFPLPDGVTDCL